MKEPGPDHPIVIAPYKGRVVVRFGDTVVADTTEALELREASYKPVFYIPRAAAKLAAYERSPHHTYCPYKGEASYFHLASGGHRADNAVWTYEAPYPAVAIIKDHVAFYPDKVTFASE
jgi:uncharacterized protein (DUF427 family)